ncbi:MAG: hypothetical protein AAGG01_16220 [Planctomycetota bacterium]
MGLKNLLRMLPLLVLAPALAQAPLKNANFGSRISGPAIEPESLEGKVVLLEYFGYY